MEEATSKAFGDAVFMLKYFVALVILITMPANDWAQTIVHRRAFGDGPEDLLDWALTISAMFAIAMIATSIVMAAYLFIACLGELAYWVYEY
jgi:hypothetical protein